VAAVAAAALAILALSNHLSLLLKDQSNLVLLWSFCLSSTVFDALDTPEKAETARFVHRHSYIVATKAQS